MTQGQGELIPRRCPRCGGLMQKPAGSSLYWHTDNNHPRCDITNLVDAPPAILSDADESAGAPNGPPKGNRRKK